jgi:hypothetical protein
MPGVGEGWPRPGRRLPYCVSLHEGDFHGYLGWRRTVVAQGSGEVTLLDQDLGQFRGVGRPGNGIVGLAGITEPQRAEPLRDCGRDRAPVVVGQDQVRVDGDLRVHAIHVMTAW